MAKVNAERDIEETRRRVERVEREYADATVYQTSLEKEIAVYRELLESKYGTGIFRFVDRSFSLGPGGLRGCADRIVQNAEQKALERPPSSNYKYRSDSMKTTRTISHSYVNRRDSNYSTIDPYVTTSLRSYVNQSPPPLVSNSYQTSTIFRTIPVQDEVNRHSSSSDSTIRDNNSRDSIIRDYDPRDDTQQHSLVRERTPSSSSSSSSSTSSTSSQESLVRRNTGQDDGNGAEYEVIVDT